jgi:hypothetical protein
MLPITEVTERSMSRLSLLASAVSVALCGSGAAMAASIDWPTYGFTSLRSNYNPSETAITPATVTGLTPLWSFNAKAFDTSIGTSINPNGDTLGGQPIVAANVTTASGTTDLVLIGDNSGTFFALDANTTTATGSVIWYRSLGTTAVGAPVNKAYGIRSTAALDHSGTGTVYVGDATQVYGLALTTGAILPGWPVSTVAAGAPSTDGFMHDALNFVDKYVVVGTSGVGIDQPPYYAKVAFISTSLHKVVASWYPMTGNDTLPTVSGGGIWGWGGIAIETGDKAGGIYVATGNAVGTPLQQVDDAENIVNLNTKNLKLVGAATPTFAAQGDDDYGSTPLVFTPQGCGTKLVAVKSKTGMMVVDTVAADGSLAVGQTLTVTTPGGTDFKGTAAWDPVDQLVLVTNDQAGPAPYGAGLVAFHAACTAPYLSFAWQTISQNGTPIMVNGGQISSPTVINGLAFFGAEDLAGDARSVVYAVLTAPVGSQPAGTIVWTSKLITGTFDSALPTVVNGKLLFSTVSTQPTLYAFGLPD